MDSKIYKFILINIGILIVLLLVLRLGMLVGMEKERFSNRWLGNYPCNFGGPREGMMGNFPGEFKSHGDFGKIIKIALPTIDIKGDNDVEKVVSIKDDTIIEHAREKISSSNLKVGDQIVVIGSANNAGQIEAKLIRVMP